MFPFHIRRCNVILYSASTVEDTQLTLNTQSTHTSVSNGTQTTPCSLSRESYTASECDV